MDIRIKQCMIHTVQYFSCRLIQTCAMVDNKTAVKIIFFFKLFFTLSKL